MTTFNPAQSSVKPIGILGGTFDPVHLGHLHLATQLYQRLGLQEVRLIPCYQSSLKTTPVATPQQRLTLTRLACEGQPGLVVDDCEIRRGKISYTYDTLVELRQEFGNTPLCLLMASDVFSHFTQWHRWQEIIQLAHIVIVMRPGFPFKPEIELQQFGASHQIYNIKQLGEKPGGYILYVDFPQNPISATEIRQRIANHQSIEHLVPKAVWQYIGEQKLYCALAP